MAYPAAPDFRAAGYAEIRTNSHLVGGKVRQHDGVSFSRVHQAGHAVDHYQPETVYQIYRRSILGLDIATGETAANSSYSSTGLSTALEKVDLPEPPESVCYVYSVGLLCTEEQQAGFQNGTAMVKDFVVVWPPSKKASMTGPSGGGGGASNGTGTKSCASAEIVFDGYLLGLMLCGFICMFWGA